jgi:hypothetical protein
VGLEALVDVTTEVARVDQNPISARDILDVVHVAEVRCGPIELYRVGAGRDTAPHPAVLPPRQLQRITEEAPVRA